MSAIFIWIFSATCVRKIESVLKKFVSLHKRLQGVGLEKDRKRDFLDKMALHCLLVNSFFWIHTITLVAMLLMTGQLNFSTIIYQFSRVISWNGVVLFIYGISFIRGKFQSINDSIKNFHFYSEVNGDRREVQVAQ
nr:gustatory receptor 1 [Psyttalia incisi]